MRQAYEDIVLIWTMGEPRCRLARGWICVFIQLWSEAATSQVTTMGGDTARFLPKPDSSIGVGVPQAPLLT